MDRFEPQSGRERRALLDPLSCTGHRCRALLHLAPQLEPEGSVGAMLAPGRREFSGLRRRRWRNLNDAEEGSGRVDGKAGGVGKDLRTEVGPVRLAQLRFSLELEGWIASGPKDRSLLLE